VGRGFKRAAGAVKAEAVPRLRPSILKTMNRRELLARGLIGAGALAAGRWIGTPILRRFIHNPRLSVHFAFLEHHDKSDTMGLVRVLENARREGRPFQIMAIEGALGPDELAHAQATRNRFLPSMKEMYAKNPQVDAETENEFLGLLTQAKKLEGGKHPEFNAQIWMLTAKYGLQYHNVERYSGEEISRLLELQKGYADATEAESRCVVDLFTARQALDAKAERLAQQATFNQLDAMFEANGRYVRTRNERIAKGLDELIKNAGREYPELRNAKPLRVLMVAGSSHSAVYENVTTAHPLRYETSMDYQAPSSELSKLLTFFMETKVRNPRQKLPLKFMQRFVELQMATIAKSIEKP
jgi:hypothetical protein